MRKILSLLLMFILLITLCACWAGTSTTLDADTASQDSVGSRSVVLTTPASAGIVPGSDILKSNAGEDGAQTVWFGDQNWYVIGYDGDGNTSVAKEDVVTLLQKTADQQVPFNEIPGNAYRGSTLEDYLENMLADGSHAIFTEQEQTAIASRKLEGGSANHGQDGYDGSKIKGESVTVPLWPLSAAEEEIMPASLVTVGIGSSWWLRTPGDDDTSVQAVNGDGTVVSKGMDASQSVGIRPAFDLDYSAVLFTSSAEGGKKTGAEGADALVPVASDSSGEWKLTLKDDGSIDGLSGHSRFSVGSISTCDGKTLRIDYSGAATGSNEYISAVIINSSGEITYYGRISSAGTSSGSISVNVEGKLSDGEILYVYNEQFNGDKKTDYASDLKKITVPADADHQWKDATCTEPKTCVICGAVEGDPLGHNWQEATCTEPKTCSVCGATDGDPLGHDWVFVSCTEPRTCSVCGATESEAPGHDWKDATCTEPRTCSVCGETEGEPLGHTWKEATCTEPKTCSICHVTEGEALGHTPGQEVKENEIAPTCEENGSYENVVTCEVCHAELSREKHEIPALGHDWDEGKVTKEATCEDKGEKTFTCRNDPSHTKKEEIDPLGHNWDEGKITKEATCEEKGEKTFTCKNDPSHTKKEEIKELGHDWSDWKTTKEPTTEAKGERERICSRCEKKEMEEIDALKGYKVTFDTMGGSAVAAQTVAENKTVTKPKDPTKDGYTFTGWYADSECKTAFDFKTAITADITLYAGWKEDEKPTPASYTIVENADGSWEKGSGKSHTIVVKRVEDDAKCFEHYKETLVDGKSATVYASAGSTVIILSPDSLEKLSVGAHTVTIRFDDGEATAFLTVKEAPPVEPDDTDDAEPPEEPDTPDTPDEPDVPDDSGEPDVPDDPNEPDVPDDKGEPVPPNAPDDSETPDNGGGKKSLLWLIAIPVVAAGGAAGIILGRRRRR